MFRITWEEGTENPGTWDALVLTTRKWWWEVWWGEDPKR